MKAYIKDIEIYEEDDEYIIARIKMFDEENWSVTINDRVMEGKDLKYIAKILDDLKDGEYVIGKGKL